MKRFSEGITREQAHAIAEGFLRERAPMPGWEGVERVSSPEETLEALHSAVRQKIPANAPARRCWAAYVRGSARGIIYVSAAGEVEFAGAIRGEPDVREG
jgi:hypothetical protein